MIWRYNAIYGVVPHQLLLYAAWVSERQFEKAKRQLADAIRRRRAALGLSQEDVADRVDIATRHYQKLESAQVNVTLRTLVKVAKALQVDLHSLF